MASKGITERFPCPSSTLISGPGETGKPLVEFAFVSSWLKSGGSVIGILLQYPTVEFVKAEMRKLYNVNPENCHGKMMHIQVDPFVDEYEGVGNDILWEEAADNLMYTQMEKPMRLFLGYLRREK